MAFKDPGRFKVMRQMASDVSVTTVSFGDETMPARLPPIEIFSAEACYYMQL
jgi:hypothetical protein